MAQIKIDLYGTEFETEFLSNLSFESFLKRIEQQFGVTIRPSDWIRTDRVQQRIHTILDTASITFLFQDWLQEESLRMTISRTEPSSKKGPEVPLSASVVETLARASYEMNRMLSAVLGKADLAPWAEVSKEIRYALKLTAVMAMRGCSERELSEIFVARLKKDYEKAAPTEDLLEVSKRLGEFAIAKDLAALITVACRVMVRDLMTMMISDSLKAQGTDKPTG